MTTFEDVRPIADAVLFEGYVLYPYRADDPKNLVRWQFGVLVPPDVAVADPSERSALHADLLLEGRAPALDVRVRFLQVQRRTVQRATADGMEQVGRLDAGDTVHLPFDEAVVREVDVHADATEVGDSSYEQAFTVPGGIEVEAVDGGRLTRERLPLNGSVTLAAERLPGPYGVSRLSVDVRNATRWASDARAPRQEVLREALVAAHVLVRVEGGAFVSLTDPPEWAAGYVAACRNEGTWPVLAGAPGSRDLVLCSPIILYDHPQVAPESTTEFFDGTEIDEMLSLRTLTLTDEEKRTARGTDPRTAGLLDQVEGLPPELMDRLHGAVRYLSQTARRVEPDEAEDPAAGQGIQVGGVVLTEGSRVLLRPGSRRADAQDIFLAGRAATVTRVLHDVDGGHHLAVVLEDDEGQDLARAQGRFLYFAPDEVEPLGVAP